MNDKDNAQNKVFSSSLLKRLCRQAGISKAVYAMREEVGLQIIMQSYEEGVSLIDFPLITLADRVVKIEVNQKIYDIIKVEAMVGRDPLFMWMDCSRTLTLGHNIIISVNDDLADVAKLYKAAIGNADTVDIKTMITSNYSAMDLEVEMKPVNFI
ncbi:MAG: hypothetical protein Q4P13_09915 [Psychrobacter sp.]|nr:hypothetical protein [Psychrobacter sp.]